MNILIVVDMQNDFITGALGSQAAKDIVGAVAGRVSLARQRGEMIFFTMDAHGEEYMSTQEGKNLPVPHCRPGTPGYELAPEIENVSDGCARVVKTDSFGSAELIDSIGRLCGKSGFPSGRGLTIEICGLCAEICVIVNALMLKAIFPEALMIVNPRLTAGLSPKGLDSALEVMRSCQIKVAE